MLSFKLAFGIAWPPAEVRPDGLQVAGRRCTDFHGTASRRVTSAKQRCWARLPFSAHGPLQEMVS